MLDHSSPGNPGLSKVRCMRTKKVHHTSIFQNIAPIALQGEIQTVWVLIANKCNLIHILIIMSTHKPQNASYSLEGGKQLTELTTTTASLLLNLTFYA